MANATPARYANIQVRCIGPWMSSQHIETLSCFPGAHVLVRCFLCWPADIFRRAPEVMYQALVQHNSVLRAAKYHNGGFVLEQEGDSYTIAFYNPFHAMVFCLQVRACAAACVHTLLVCMCTCKCICICTR
jgi:hypothetical protein